MTYEVSFLLPITVSVEAQDAATAESLALSIKPSWFKDAAVKTICTTVVRRVRVKVSETPALLPAEQGKPV